MIVCAPWQFTADVFDVDPATIASCKRQEEGKCPGDPPHPHHTLHHTATSHVEADEEAEDPLEARIARLLSPFGTRRTSLLEIMIREASRMMLVKDGEAGTDSGTLSDDATTTSLVDEEAVAPRTSLPAFPQSYISTEEETLRVVQGGALDPTSGNTCCAVTTPGQCQVQMAHGTFTRYVDAKTQQVRIEDTTADTILVDRYASLESIIVNVSASGVESCAYICPLAPGETFSNFSMPTNAKDRGAATFHGKPAERYTWIERALKVIKMGTVELLVGKDGAGHNIPLFESEDLTPLGRPSIGKRNRTYTTFIAGAPPAAKFDIAGVATCPKEPPGKGSKCDGPAMQARRLASGQHLTWAMYERE